ncbi:MAG TPA: hypothetical protein VGP38_04900 [Rubrobacter sp.]|nr:hypothetical protein [Rubrobacter sp.]
MSNRIPLRKPGAEVGDRHDLHADFNVDPFDLYGRHHEVTAAEADIGVTKVSDGLHLDLRVRATLATTCDRTLEPTEIVLQFGDSELLAGADDEELGVDDWTLDLKSYAERTLPNEVPLQVFREGTQPVGTEDDADEIDPRWRGLDGISVSGF